MTWTTVARAIARYYLSLRMSAALAIPDLATLEIPNPTPIVRQLPARMLGEWDERELIRTDGAEWVVVRDAARNPLRSFSWN